MIRGLRKQEEFNKTVRLACLISIFQMIIALGFGPELINAEPRMLTVDDDGPADFVTISEALTAASEGDSIYVLSGDYNECLTVAKRVSIIGQDKETTIVDGNERDTTITVVEDRVNISGLTVQNSKADFDFSGIYLNQVSQCFISDNNIATNHDGIQLYGSSNNLICGNAITSNLANGIYLYLSSNNKVLRNRVEGNLLNAIYDYEGSNNEISENDITRNYFDGISLQYSRNNEIHGNSLLENRNGLWLQYCTGNEISENHVENNTNGIYLYESEGNRLLWNRIVRNHVDGMYLFRFSDNNTISGNNITLNLNGLYLYRASGNLIYQNNFVGNSNQTVVLPGYANIWDGGYSCWGNYWSQLDCQDADADGIGDNGYTVDPQNVDNYPLRYPVSVFKAGSWSGKNYFIGIVNNFSVSGFTLSSHESLVSFNATGRPGEVGFCGTIIPRDLLWCTDADGWIVMLDGIVIPRAVITGETHTYVYFACEKGGRTEVRSCHVIPEFRLLNAFLICTTVLLAVLMKTRRASHKLPANARMNSLPATSNCLHSSTNRSSRRRCLCTRTVEPDQRLDSRSDYLPLIDREGP